MQPADQQTARITLLALRETTPRPAGAGPLYVPVPGGVPLRESEMLDWLVRLAKPIQCVGFDIAGMLGVGYWALDAYAVACRAPFPPPEDLHLIAPDAPQSAWTAGPRVLVAGHDESLLVDYEVLQLWSRDYVLSFLSIDWNDEDSRTASAGAIAVVGFRPMSREHRAYGSSSEGPEER